MSESHELESEFSQLLRRVPFDDAPRAEHHDALREQVLAKFDEAEQSDVARPRWKRALHTGREIMRRPIPRLIAVTTASLLIAITWLFVPGQLPTAQAFNKLADAVVAAKTARFHMEVQIEGQPKQSFQAWYLAPGKFRQELLGAINISDFKAGKIVNLQPALKTAFIMNIKNQPKDKPSDNYFDRVRELLSKTRDAKTDQFERLGEKEIGGKRAVGFRFDSPAETVTLWGDPATGQPVRIESVWSGIPRTEVAMSDFEINVEVKESLFDLTPPADYKVQSMDVDASKPDEKALVEAFKTSSEFADGDFPESLDMTGIMNLVIKFAVKRGTNISEEDTQNLMKQSFTIGHGIGFALQLPDSADAHYAGKGVKRDEKDKPIFWYKPEGQNKYRVIYADLTVKDADTAPKVEGAKRIEKASKTTKAAEKK